MYSPNLPNKSANKHILNFAVAQVVLNYNVGCLKGHLCDELKFAEKNNNVQSRKTRQEVREAVAQGEEAEEGKGQNLTVLGPFKLITRRHTYTCY